MMKFNKSDIIDEYNQSCSSNDEEYKKAKWGSDDSMKNRFLLFEKLIDSSEINNLLDVGCGTGSFIRQIKNKFPQVEMFGVDISDNMISFCKTADPSGNYSCCDFIELKYKDYFDVITMFGLLQKTNHTLEEIFSYLSKLANYSGKILFTSKNLSWKNFTSNKMVPEKDHNWFYPSQVEEILNNNKFKIISSGGFIPDKNKIVKFEDSHTFYYLVQK